MRRIWIVAGPVMGALLACGAAAVLASDQGPRADHRGGQPRQHVDTQAVTACRIVPNDTRSSMSCGC